MTFQCFFVTWVYNTWYLYVFYIVICLCCTPSFFLSLSTCLCMSDSLSQTTQLSARITRYSYLAVKFTDFQGPRQDLIPSSCVKRAMYGQNWSNFLQVTRSICHSFINTWRFLMLRGLKRWQGSKSVIFRPFPPPGGRSRVYRILPRNFYSSRHVSNNSSLRCVQLKLDFPPDLLFWLESIQLRKWVSGSRLAPRVAIH